MIELELRCFLELDEDYAKYQTQLSVLNSKIINTKKEIKDLKKSKKSSVGFFKKKPKNMKIQELESKIKQNEEKVKKLRKILDIAVEIIFKEQIEIIEEAKRLRLKNTIEILSKDMIQINEININYWKTVHESNAITFSK